MSPEDEEASNRPTASKILQKFFKGQEMSSWNHLLISIENYQINMTRNIARAQLRYINSASIRLRRTQGFLNDVRKQLAFLRFYNEEVYKSKKKFPHTKWLMQLLVRYVALEYEVWMYLGGRKETEMEVKNRMLYLLYLMLNDPKESRTKPSNKTNLIILKIVLAAKQEYKVSDEFCNNLVRHILDSAGLLNEVENIYKQKNTLASNVWFNRRLNPMVNLEEYGTDSEDSDIASGDESSFVIAETNSAVRDLKIAEKTVFGDNYNRPFKKQRDFKQERVENSVYDETPLVHQIKLDLDKPTEHSDLRPIKTEFRTHECIHNKVPSQVKSETNLQSDVILLDDSEDETTHATTQELSNIQPKGEDLSDDVVVIDDEDDVLNKLEERKPKMLVLNERKIKRRSKLKVGDCVVVESDSDEEVKNGRKIEEDSRKNRRRDTILKEDNVLESSRTKCDQPTTTYENCSMDSNQRHVVKTVQKQELPVCSPDLSSTRSLGAIPKKIAEEVQGDALEFNTSFAKRLYDSVVPEKYQGDLFSLKARRDFCTKLEELISPRSYLEKQKLADASKLENERSSKDFANNVLTPQIRHEKEKGESIAENTSKEISENQENKTNELETEDLLLETNASVFEVQNNSNILKHKDFVDIEKEILEEIYEQETTNKPKLKKPSKKSIDTTKSIQKDKNEDLKRNNESKLPSLSEIATLLPETSRDNFSVSTSLVMEVSSSNTNKTTPNELKNPIEVLAEPSIDSLIESKTDKSSYEQEGTKQISTSTITESSSKNSELSVENKAISGVEEEEVALELGQQQKVSEDVAVMESREEMEDCMSKKNQEEQSEEAVQMDEEKVVETVDNEEVVPIENVETEEIVPVVKETAEIIINGSFQVAEEKITEIVQKKENGAINQNLEKSLILQDGIKEVNNVLENQDVIITACDSNENNKDRLLSVEAVEITRVETINFDGNEDKNSSIENVENEILNNSKEKDDVQKKGNKYKKEDIVKEDVKTGGAKKSRGRGKKLKEKEEIVEDEVVLDSSQKENIKKVAKPMEIKKNTGEVKKRGRKPNPNKKIEEPVKFDKDILRNHKDIVDIVPVSINENNEVLPAECTEGFEVKIPDGLEILPIKETKKKKDTRQGTRKSEEDVISITPIDTSKAHPNIAQNNKKPNKVKKSPTKLLKNNQKTKKLQSQNIDVYDIPLPPGPEPKKQYSPLKKLSENKKLLKRSPEKTYNNLEDAYEEISEDELDYDNIADVGDEMKKETSNLDVLASAAIQQYASLKLSEQVPEKKTARGKAKSPRKPRKKKDANIDMTNKRVTRSCAKIQPPPPVKVSKEVKQFSVVNEDSSDSYEGKLIIPDEKSGDDEPEPESVLITIPENEDVNFPILEQVEELVKMPEVKTKELPVNKPTKKLSDLAIQPEPIPDVETVCKNLEESKKTADHRVDEIVEKSSNEVVNDEKCVLKTKAQLKSFNKSEDPDLENTDKHPEDLKNNTELKIDIVKESEKKSCVDEGNDSAATMKENEEENSKVNLQILQEEVEETKVLSHATIADQTIQNIEAEKNVEEVPVVLDEDKKTDVSSSISSQTIENLISDNEVLDFTPIAESTIMDTSASSITSEVIQETLECVAESTGIDEEFEEISSEELKSDNTDIIDETVIEVQVEGRKEELIVETKTEDIIEESKSEATVATLEESLSCEVEISSEKNSAETPNSICEDISENVAENVVSEEIVTQEVVEESVTEELVTEEIVTEEAVAEMVFEEAVTEEVATEEVVSEEVVSEEEMVTEEVVAEEVLPEAVAKQDAVTENSVAEEVVTEHIVSEEVSADEVPAEHVSEELVTEQVLEDVVTEHVSEEVVAEHIGSEDVLTEEVAVEEVVADHVVSDEVITPEVTEEVFADEVVKQSGEVQHIQEQINGQQNFFVTTVCDKVIEEIIDELLCKVATEDSKTVTKIDENVVSIEEKSTDIFTNSNTISSNEDDKMVICEDLPIVTENIVNESETIVLTPVISSIEEVVVLHSIEEVVEDIPIVTEEIHKEIATFIEVIPELATAVTTSIIAEEPSIIVEVRPKIVEVVPIIVEEPVAAATVEVSEVIVENKKEVESHKIEDKVVGETEKVVVKESKKSSSRRHRRLESRSSVESDSEIKKTKISKEDRKMSTAKDNLNKQESSKDSKLQQDCKSNKKEIVEEKVVVGKKEEGKVDEKLNKDKEVERKKNKDVEKKESDSKKSKSVDSKRSKSVDQKKKNKEESLDESKSVKTEKKKNDEKSSSKKVEKEKVHSKESRGKDNEKCKDEKTIKDRVKEETKRREDGGKEEKTSKSSKSDSRSRSVELIPKKESKHKEENRSKHSKGSSELDIRSKSLELEKIKSRDRSISTERKSKESEKTKSRERSLSIDRENKKSERHSEKRKSSSREKTPAESKSKSENKSLKSKDSSKGYKDEKKIGKDKSKDVEKKDKKSSEDLQAKSRSKDGLKEEKKEKIENKKEVSEKKKNDENKKVESKVLEDKQKKSEEIKSNVDIKKKKIDQKEDLKEDKKRKSEERKKNEVEIKKRKVDEDDIREEKTLKERLEEENVEKGSKEIIENECHKETIEVDLISKSDVSEVVTKTETELSEEECTKKMEKDCLLNSQKEIEKVVDANVGQPKLENEVLDDEKKLISVQEKPSKKIEILADYKITVGEKAKAIKLDINTETVPKNTVEKAQVSPMKSPETKSNYRSFDVVNLLSPRLSKPSLFTINQIIEKKSPDNCVNRRIDFQNQIGPVAENSEVKEKQKIDVDVPSSSRKNSESDLEQVVAKKSVKGEKRKAPCEEANEVIKRMRKVPIIDINTYQESVQRDIMAYSMQMEAQKGKVKRENKLREKRKSINEIIKSLQNHKNEAEDLVEDKKEVVEGDGKVENVKDVVEREESLAVLVVEENKEIDEEEIVENPVIEKSPVVISAIEEVSNSNIEELNEIRKSEVASEKLLALSEEKSRTEAAEIIDRNLELPPKTESFTVGNVVKAIPELMSVTEIPILPTVDPTNILEIPPITISSRPKHNSETLPTPLEIQTKLPMEIPQATIPETKILEKPSIAKIISDDFNDDDDEEPSVDFQIQNIVDTVTEASDLSKIPSVIVEHLPQYGVNAIPTTSDIIMQSKLTDTLPLVSSDVLEAFINTEQVPSNIIPVSIAMKSVLPVSSASLDIINKVDAQLLTSTVNMCSQLNTPSVSFVNDLHVASPSEAEQSDKTFGSLDVDETPLCEKVKACGFIQVGIRTAEQTCVGGPFMNEQKSNENIMMVKVMERLDDSPVDENDIFPLSGQVMIDTNLPSVDIPIDNDLLILPDASEDMFVPTICKEETIEHEEDHTCSESNSPLDVFNDDVDQRKDEFSASVMSVEKMSECFIDSLTHLSQTRSISPRNDKVEEPKINYVNFGADLTKLQCKDSHLSIEKMSEFLNNSLVQQLAQQRPVSPRNEKIEVEPKINNVSYGTDLSKLHTSKEPRFPLANFAFDDIEGIKFSEQVNWPQNSTEPPKPQDNKPIILNGHIGVPELLTPTKNVPKVEVQTPPVNLEKVPIPQVTPEKEEKPKETKTKTKSSPRIGKVHLVSLQKLKSEAVKTEAEPSYAVRRSYDRTRVSAPKKKSPKITSPKVSSPKVASPKSPEVPKVPPETRVVKKNDISSILDIRPVVEAKETRYLPDFKIQNLDPKSKAKKKPTFVRTITPDAPTTQKRKIDPAEDPEEKNKKFKEDVKKNSVLNNEERLSDLFDQVCKQNVNDIPKPPSTLNYIPPEKDISRKRLHSGSEDRQERSEERPHCSKDASPRTDYHYKPPVLHPERELTFEERYQRNRSPTHTRTTRRSPEFHPKPVQHRPPYDPSSRHVHFKDAPPSHHRRHPEHYKAPPPRTSRAAYPPPPGSDKNKLPQRHHEETRQHYSGRREDGRAGHPEVFSSYKENSQEERNRRFMEEGPSGSRDYGMSRGRSTRTHRAEFKSDGGRHSSQRESLLQFPLSNLRLGNPRLSGNNWSDNDTAWLEPVNKLLPPPTVLFGNPTETSRIIEENHN